VSAGPPSPNADGALPESDVFDFEAWFEQQWYKILRALLQHFENAPLTGQGCTGLARCSAGRTHCVTCAGQRTSSPIRPNLSFRHTQECVVRSSLPASENLHIAHKRSLLVAQKSASSSVGRWPIHTGTGLAAVGKLSAKFDLSTRARGLTYTHAPLCRLTVASEAQSGSSENTALGFMAAPLTSTKSDTRYSASRRSRGRGR
jgi:hypothetical protein